MKTATNIAQTINYSTIAKLEEPTSKVAVDDDGNKFTVPGTAKVGDVLVFATDPSHPTYMTMDDFKVGRTI